MSIKKSSAIIYEYTALERLINNSLFLLQNMPVDDYIQDKPLVPQVLQLHEERYRALLKNVEAMEVFKKSGVTMWECRNCGHVVVGLEAPEVCPVCNHPQAYFEVRKENY